MTKRLLYLISQDQSQPLTALDGLDAALASAVFDQQIELLFWRRGLQLLSAPDPETLERLIQLPVFGIERVLVFDPAGRHNSDWSSLPIQVDSLTHQDLSLLLADQDCAFHF